MTSYAEVVLAPPAADALHPAFSNLFVQTEIRARRGRRSCARAGRARADEQPPWMFHLMTVHGATVGRGVVRDRPHALHRPRRTPWPHPQAMTRAGAAVRTARARCSIRSSRSGSAITLRAERDGDGRPGHRHRRDARRPRWAGREVPRPAPGRPRVRAGLDAQPGRCCASSTPPRPTPSSTAGWPAR